MSQTQTIDALSIPLHLIIDTNSSWQDVSRAKIISQLSRIPTEWRISSSLLTEQGRESCDLTHLAEKSGILSLLELEITEILSVHVLAQRIAARLYTAEQVTVAFCKRAAIAHQITNCLTEIFFEEAILAARELDKVDFIKGPFHGIPISLKDQFNVIGEDSSIGYVSRSGQPATVNSCIVDSILSQGAVVYCKTNVPQTVMTADTVNNLFGRTLNPVNKYIIPGGSSGGEAALLAFGGSILGIGTDTGGSIRIPSAACELYGLKPSAGRVSYKNVVSSNDGNTQVISVAGPMARTLDSLEYFMKHTLSSAPWLLDHEVHPIPWRTQTLTATSLKIGIMLNHGDFPPHPCFSRIMNEMRARLESVGVTVITWESPELSMLHQDLAAVLGSLCVMDGGHDIAKHLEESGEPLILSGLVDARNVLSVNQVWTLMAKARSLRNRYLELWRASNIDALVTPTNPFAALSVEQYANKSAEIGYTGIFNILDYAVVNFPGGRVVETELTEEQKRWGLAGFKVGCQVVTGRLEEEKALAITHIIESACGVQAKQ